MSADLDRNVVAFISYRTPKQQLIIMVIKSESAIDSRNTHLIITGASMKGFNNNELNLKESVLVA